MALALTVEDKAWILDAIGDSLAGFLVAAPNADIQAAAERATAVSAARVVAAAYTGP